jgi:hypothetical protein
LSHIELVVLLIGNYLYITVDLKMKLNILVVLAHLHLGQATFGPTGGTNQGCVLRPGRRSLARRAGNISHEPYRLGIFERFLGVHLHIEILASRLEISL